MMGERMPRLVLPALTGVARGMPCMLRIPNVCNGNPETTVWCHANSGNGKGMSAKCDDWFGTFGCADCHRYIDEPKNTDEAEFLYALAHRRTIRFLFNHDILKIDAKAAKRVRHYA